MEIYEPSDTTNIFIIIIFMTTTATLELFLLIAFFRLLFVLFTILVDDRITERIFIAFLFHIVLFLLSFLFNKLSKHSESFLQVLIEPEPIFISHPKTHDK